jgi:hypothetical protein
VVEAIIWPMAGIRETIVPLVDELRRLDPQLRVFGRERRGYRFNDRLSIATVRAFETQHGVELPADYREFVTEVGDGGAGPHYGVESLAEASEYSTLSKPFPWTSETKLTDEDLEVWEANPGVLILAERGCAYTDFMVVNGDAPYRIWSDFIAADGPLTPSHESFTTWYVAWATRCIATIKREPLIERVRVGMTVDELRGIFGTDMQQWEGAKLPNSPAYHIGFTNTNATFRMGSDDRVISVYKTDQV